MELSPRWLVAQDHVEEARSVLMRVRESEDDVSEELLQISDALKELGFSVDWKSTLPLLISPENRKATMISITLAMFVQVRLSRLILSLFW